MKLLLYCTKSKPYLLREDIDKDLVFIGTNKTDVVGNILNGKIVAKCDFEVEEIYLNNNVIMGTKTLNSYDLVVKSKVEIDQMRDYFKGKNGYAIHIKNLHIFNKPKELSEFYKPYVNSKSWQRVNKAPQNMMYCCDKFGNFYVLISIHPEWLCKILNGEKIIEVRKKVLKGMLKNDR